MYQVKIKFWTWDTALRDERRFYLYFLGYSEFRGYKYPRYPDGCRTIAEPRLTIKINCFLTLFIVIFANELGARTDFVRWNAVIDSVSAANEAVPGTSESSWREQVYSGQLLYKPVPPAYQHSMSSNSSKIRISALYQLIIYTNQLKFSINRDAAIQK